MSLGVAAASARSFAFERILPGMFFATFAVLGIVRHEAETSLEWARLGVNVWFIATIGYLYLIRRPRLGGRSSLAGAVVGIAGTFMPMTLAVAPVTADATWLAIGTGVTIVGIATSIVALSALGRCFGIFPEVRGLVTHGPYRWVRHPLYLGEFIAVAGIVISALSPIALLLYVAFIALQAQRAVNEERALVAAMPEYRDYQQRTARIVPFVW